MPRSLAEAVKTLTDRGPDAKLVAGGTDLLPQMKNGLLKPPCVVDLSGVPRLRTVEPDGRGLRVGAAVPARVLERDRVARSTYTSLSRVYDAARTSLTRMATLTGSGRKTRLERYCTSWRATKTAGSGPTSGPASAARARSRSTRASWR